MKSSRVALAFFTLCIASYLNAEVLLFSQAYKLALENANDIKSSEYMAAIEKERINQEKAALYPQINLSAYYRKTEYVFNNATQNSLQQGLINGGLSIRQSVYNPEIYSRIAIQKNRSKYNEARVNFYKKDLAKNVFDAYLNVLKSKNKIDYLNSRLMFNASKLKQLNAKYDMNLANKMDLLQMKVEYSSSKIELTKEKKLFEVYSLELQQFIGNSSYDLPKFNTSASLLKLIKIMKLSIHQDINSLEVKQAEIALQISKEQITNAKDGHLPKINFEANYALYSTDDPTVDAPYKDVKFAMLTLNIPIYSGGYTSSNVASSQLQYHAAFEDLQNAKKSVQVDYDRNLALFDTSVESVLMYKEAIDSAELYVDAVDQGLNSGLKSILDFNDARSKLYEVKYMYAQNIFDLIHSYVGLLIDTNSFDEIEILDKILLTKR